MRMLKLERLVKVSDYMAAVIASNGEISYLGYDFSFAYHAQCLIDYAISKYPTAKVFKNLDYMEEPNGPVYYLTKLLNVVFTNVSVDDEKRGMLFLPNTLNSKQIKSLYELMEEIKDFSIYIVYDLEYDDNMVVGKEVSLDDIKVLDDFCQKRGLKVRG